MQRQPAEEMERQTQGMLSIMEGVPVQAYLLGAVASTALSALLFVTGRRHWGLFLGQWPMTIMASALVYRMLRPNRERPREAARETMEKGREVFEMGRGAMRRQRRTA